MGVRRALVFGGTRGIGAALTTLLRKQDWEVEAWGRGALDFTDLRAITTPLVIPPADFVCFCAGELNPFPWDRKHYKDYHAAYLLHALGPVLILATNKGTVFPWWCRVCLVSSVGEIISGAVDLGYGMAKAALDKAAKALAEHESWSVHLVRFDAVETDTFYRIPTETLHGRAVLSPMQAAMQIVEECGL